MTTNARNAEPAPIGHAGAYAVTGDAPDEIAQRLALKPFQGKQIFQWIHQKRVLDFEAMTNLSKELRIQLKENCAMPQIRLARLVESPQSGTRKAVFELRDSETVESVLIRDEQRVTICLSSQAGCPLNCAFCATGQSGFRRNLQTAEILEQALHLLKDEDLAGHTPNIVYMGMGEPFCNYDAVTKSIRIMMMPEGLGIGARRITVSTVGDVPGIRRFAEEHWQVRLAVSLHAANDILRSRLVPLNRKYPLDTLRRALQHYTSATGRQFSIEWVLMAGLNDSPECAAEFAAWMRDLDAVVNLIPCNPVPGAEFRAPSRTACEAFYGALQRQGVKATLRREKGLDIDAACGQLRANTPPSTNPSIEEDPNQPPP